MGCMDTLCLVDALPLTWTGFSVQAFSGLLDFVKLSAASGCHALVRYYSAVISRKLNYLICQLWLQSFENFLAAWKVWYYRMLILMTGYVKNATSAVDASAVWYFDYPSDIPLFNLFRRHQFSSKNFITDHN